MSDLLKTCHQLMERHQVPAHIRRHSVLVAKVAYCIGTALCDKAGLALSLETVVGGALLHDIGKHQALENGEGHAELGRQICEKSRLNGIAEVVAQHVSLRAFDPLALPSEKEIVYYADKRVNHDAVVSLWERRAYILERYSRNSKTIRGRIKRNFDICKQVEAKLFRSLPFGPDEITQRIEEQAIGFEALRRTEFPESSNDKH